MARIDPIEIKKVKKKMKKIRAASRGGARGHGHFRMRIQDRLVASSGSATLNPLFRRMIPELTVKKPKN